MGASTCQDQLDSSFREYQKNPTGSLKPVVDASWRTIRDGQKQPVMGNDGDGNAVVLRRVLQDFATVQYNQVLEDMVLWAQPASLTTLMRAKTMHQQANQAAGDVAASTSTIQSQVDKLVNARLNAALVKGVNGPVSAISDYGMLRAGRQLESYPQVLRRTLFVHPSLQEKQGRTPSKFPAASGTHASSRQEDMVAVELAPCLT